MKQRQYKTEQDVFYIGEKELASVKAVSSGPIARDAELVGFIKSFAPYKAMGLTSAKELDDIRGVDFASKLQQCETAASKRTETYVEENAKGAAGVQAKIRAVRDARLSKHRKYLANSRATLTYRFAQARQN